MVVADFDKACFLDSEPPHDQEKLIYMVLAITFGILWVMTLFILVIICVKNKKDIYSTKHNDLIDFKDSKKDK